jgi:hypothetical protein
MIDNDTREWFAKLLKEESELRKGADTSLTTKLDGLQSDVGEVKLQVQTMSKKLLGAKGLGLMLAILLAALGAAYPQAAAVVSAIGSALSSSPAAAAPVK